MGIRNIVGNVPEPDELYGRSELINRLWSQIEADNVLLLAPRRFGKTGVMNHVLERPRPNWLPIYLDWRTWIRRPSTYGDWRMTILSDPF